MGTVACSLNGTNYWNSYWASTSWYTSSGYGWLGIGANTRQKYAVIKVTSPSNATSYNAKRLQINIPLYCANTISSYPIKCRVTTTAPSFSTTPSLPTSYLAESTTNVSVTNSYANKTLYTGEFNVANNTVYYVWIWSTSTTDLYHGHSSSTGWMSVNMEYDAFAAPTVSNSTYTGYISDTTLTISANSSYPYVYVGNAATGSYWKKDLTNNTFTIFADTTGATTDKTYYIMRTNIDYGSSVYCSGVTYTKFTHSKYACAVWNGTSAGYTVVQGNSGNITLSKSGYTFKGLTSDASTSYSTYTYSSSTNGKVYYAVYTQSSSITYYRGSSTAYSASRTRYLFGKGSYTAWALTEPTRTCVSSNAYYFVGWSTGIDTTKEYDTLLAAGNDEATTVYGVYKKDGSSSSTTLYYYRGSSTRNSVTKTTTVANAYYYGKGSTSGGGTSVSYGTITLTCASDSGAEIEGWAVSSSNLNAALFSTPEYAFDAGYDTIYGKYKRTGSSSNSTVYYYRGSSTQNSVTKTTTVADKYYYGAGYTSGGGATYSYGTITSSCAADSDAGLVGWTTSSSSTASAYSTATAAFDAGNTTIYGIFRKDGSSSDSTVYYYRGSSTKNSVTKTTKVTDKYYYGVGTTSGGGTTYSYGTITSTCAADSGADVIGWTTSSSSTSSSYSTATSAFDAGNGTIYGIFKKDGSSSDSTVYYYAGSSTKNSVTKTTAVADKYYYGAGSTSGGGTTYSYGTITTDVSGWTFIGFTTSLTTTSSSSTAKSLFDAGNTTIYGTYSKSETMTYYPQNGGTSGTASTTNYLYGTGQTTKNRPTAPTLSKTNYKLSGWGTSTTDATADTWATLWDAGTRTVYAIWVPDNHVYYGVNGAWKTARVYYGVDGEWKPVVLRYGISSSWK